MYICIIGRADAVANVDSTVLDLVTLYNRTGVDCPASLVTTGLVGQILTIEVEGKGPIVRSRR